MAIQGGLKPSFCAGNLPGDARITLAGEIHRLGEGFEHDFDDMVRFIAVKQFKMEIAPGFIGESLEKLPGEPKAERARHVLRPVGFADGALGEFVQPTPDQIRSPAEINNTARQTFIHGHMRLAAKGVAGIKACSITTDAALITERLDKPLPKRDATILNGMVRIHFKIPLANKLQIHDRMSGEEREHVVEKGNPRPDGCFTGTVHIERELDFRLARDTTDPGLPRFHAQRLKQTQTGNTKPNARRRTEG